MKGRNMTRWRDPAKDPRQEPKSHLITAEGADYTYNKKEPNRVIARINYHKLDKAGLERLIYTYLGDWIRTQQAGVANGEDGADIRLAAAETLKTELEKDPRRRKSPTTSSCAGNRWLNSPLAGTPTSTTACA